MQVPPVIIVDDDIDDSELIEEAWKELKFPHPLIFFRNADDVIAYMHSDKELPFLIISSVNLPKTDGFELKKKLSEDKTTNAGSIPFVFMSGTASEQIIKKAYSVCAHGFFIKPDSLVGIKESLSDIVAYWDKSKVPTK